MKQRRSLNVLMTLLIIFVMSYQAVENVFHEIAGILLFLLFLIHNILNRKWYKNILRGKYTRFRILMLTVNILVWLSMLTAMGTGIYLSRDLFSSLWGMKEAYLIRPWHVAAGAWGMILVSIHCGIHIRLPAKKNVFWMSGCVIVLAVGICSFMALDMPNRLVLRDTGMYWSYSGILLYFANAAVMALFTGIAASAIRLFIPFHRG